VHASAVVYNGVGILMAGWAHCGKTAALLGFASKGAEYVGEEWVLLSGNGPKNAGAREAVGTFGTGMLPVCPMCAELTVASCPAFWTLRE